MLSWYHMYDLSRYCIALHKGCAYELFWVLLSNCCNNVCNWNVWKLVDCLYATLAFFCIIIYFECILTPLFCCGIMCSFFGYKQACRWVSALELKDNVDVILFLVFSLLLLWSVTLDERTLCFILFWFIVARLNVITHDFELLRY